MPMRRCTEPRRWAAIACKWVRDDRRQAIMQLQSKGETNEQEIPYRLGRAVRCVVDRQLCRPRPDVTFRLHATDKPFPGGGRPTKVFSPDVAGARDPVRRVRVDLCARRRGEAVDGTGRALWRGRRTAHDRANLYDLLRRAADAGGSGHQADPLRRRADGDPWGDRRVAVSRHGEAVAGRVTRMRVKPRPFQGGEGKRGDLGRSAFGG